MTTVKCKVIHVRTCVFISMFLKLAQVYLHKIYDKAITVRATPVLKNDEKLHFFQEIRGCYKRI